MLSGRYRWLVGAVLATVLAGCDGGRGSSGFDISENAAIRLVLETQECVTGKSLTLCPADQAGGTSPTPTPAPPTPTATPQPPQRIDTSLANGASVVCVHGATDAPCVVEFAFRPIGFPSTATFRVASRLQAPSTAWQLAPPPVPSGSDPSVLTSSVSIDGPESLDARVQFAVLVFFSEPASLPPSFTELADTNAEFAFVTPEFVLEVVLVEPTPSPTTGVPTPTPATPTATATPSIPAVGPIITYFGVARADNLPVAPSSFDDLGRPIFVRPFGNGVILIVEGRPGEGKRPVGRSAYNPTGDLPDLQVILSRPLGDGSLAVCDNEPPDPGGVPQTQPFAFNGDEMTAAAVNDLGCRADNGTGQPEGRLSDNACTAKRPGEYTFVDEATTLQFCLPIAAAWAFPLGDTIVAARLRDVAGSLGPLREIVVRIGRSLEPSPTPSRPGSSRTPTRPGAPTPSPTPTLAIGEGGPLITHFGLARADSSPMEPAGTDPSGRPIYSSRVAQGMTLIVEAQPGGSRRQPGRNAYAGSGRPDFQMILSRPLGDGSQQVCDVHEPAIGGVPGTVPFEFADDVSVTDAINDLGCRVNDGTGIPQARANTMDACTSSNFGGPTGFAFVNATSTVQFCLPIAGAWNFQPGDTVIAVRLRDQAGTLGPTKEIVVRIDPAAHRICEDDEREFFVTRPDSVFRSSTTLEDVSQDPWIHDPMVLCVGPDRAGAKRTLRLRDDVTFGVPLVDGSVLCALLDAEQSTGEIDCDGGTAYDVTVTQNSRGASPADALQIGTGSLTNIDSGPGAALLHTFFQVVLLPAGSSTDSCHRSYRSRNRVALTTAHTMVTVTDPIQGGSVAIEADGEPFDCAHLLEPGSRGTLVFPFIGLDTVVGDTANVLILAD